MGRPCYTTGGCKLTLIGNLLPETMCEAKPTACSPMLPSALCRDACSRCSAGTGHECPGTDCMRHSLYEGQRNSKC